jgi:hypothetical protein
LVGKLGTRRKPPIYITKVIDKLDQIEYTSQWMDSRERTHRTHHQVMDGSDCLDIFEPYDIHYGAHFR